MTSDDQAGLRLPSWQIRNERIAIAHEMVLKTLHEAAGFPVPQQQALREVVKHLQALQTWCRAHASGAGSRHPEESHG